MSFRKSFASARAFALVFLLALSGFLGTSGPASALTAAATVRDGNPVQLGDVTYRLDGVDAPELDQVCIDDHADPWTCGIEARDQPTQQLGGRAGACDRHGPAKNFGKRHRAICTAEGDKATLNEQLVRLGFAVAREPIRATVKPAAAAAKSASAGIWKGCFVAPQEFRTGKKDGVLLGAACRSDRDKEIRAALFPEDLTMPPSCGIKGKLAVRARVTGNIGIYHLRGCPSYPATTKPDRWFCSEDDAQAAGFRKAYNCRRPK